MLPSSMVFGVLALAVHGQLIIKARSLVQATTVPIVTDVTVSAIAR
jgi:hypothetical protein